MSHNTQEAIEKHKQVTFSDFGTSIQKHNTNYSDFNNQNYSHPTNNTNTPSIQQINQMIRQQQMTETVGNEIQKEMQIMSGYLNRQCFKKKKLILPLSSFDPSRPGKESGVFSEYNLKLLIKTKDMNIISPVKNSNGKHMFGIVTNDRVHFFIAETEVGLNKWVSSLRSARDYMLMKNNTVLNENEQTTSKINNYQLDLGTRQNEIINPNKQEIQFSGDSCSSSDSCNSMLLNTIDKVAIVDKEQNLKQVVNKDISFSQNLFTTEKECEKSESNNYVITHPEETRNNKTDTSPKPVFHFQNSELSKNTLKNELQKQNEMQINVNLEGNPKNGNILQMDKENSLALNENRYGDNPMTEILENSPRMIKIQQHLVNEHVIRAGYLYVQGKIKKWSQKWFVLRSNSLSYYPNNEEYKLIQLIPRKNVYDAIITQKSKQSSSKKTCFTLVTLDRNYTLAHNEVSVANEWISAIKQWVASKEKE
ncbi:hypothetical protein BB559_004396 [Furculomyces boomerangus]|uniref:PH domain-containing protein n=1 Tax=Furculomyces boomerangus TaxID=61424 RepID=A0A2T9YEX0_9FUNG|nr:hypothetical protein BB559_004396 [Furculomyces boomerangus]